MPQVWPEKYCLECGTKLFLSIKRDIERKKFCSRTCSSRYYAKRHITFPDYSGGMPIEIIQKMCKPKTLTPIFLQAQKERGLQRRGMYTSGKWLKCEYCGELFHSPTCRVIHGRRYCSLICKH